MTSSFTAPRGAHAYRLLLFAVVVSGYSIEFPLLCFFLLSPSCLGLNRVKPPFAAHVSSPLRRRLRRRLRLGYSRLRCMWYVYADTSIAKIKPKKFLDKERK